MRRYIIVLLSMLAICSVPCQSQTIDRALFERMVAITKHFEGWHDPKTTPGYVGYGHQLQKGERFPKTLTRQRADLLLRTDLLRHLRPAILQVSEGIPVVCKAIACLDEVEQTTKML